MSAYDPLEPDTGIPPRALHEWTAVEGHHVRGVDEGHARCVCGESQPVHDLLRRRRVVTERREIAVSEVAEVRAASRAWRDEHLATAWPVLVPRLGGEALEEHARRVDAELTGARAHRDRLDDAMDGSGEAIPVITEEQTDAGVRAAVLKHQYNKLCEELCRQLLAKGSDGQGRWMAEGYGDPLDEI